MAHSEQMIRIAQARGDLLVDRGVLAQLIGREVAATPGVVHLGPPRRERPRGLQRLLRTLAAVFGALLSPWLRPRPWIEVEVGEGEIAVQVALVAQHGVDLSALSTTLRERVSRAVRGMTGIEVRCLDVIVAGLRLEGGPERRPTLDVAGEARRRFTLDAPPATRS